MLAIATIAYASSSHADGSRPPTLPAALSSNISPPIPAEQIIQKVKQGAANASSLLGGSLRATTQSCPFVPKGALVDDHQDVWVGSTMVEHLSPCNDPQYLTPGTSGWVLSALQAADYYYFTEVYVQFLVPSGDPSPAGRNDVFIFPGIQSSGGYLLQPVLQYNQGQVRHWQMQDYAVHNAARLAWDYPQSVNDGDQIDAVVMFDFQNPGSSCSPYGHPGANCNYWMAWWDVTNGASGGFEWNSPEALNTAVGAVLEVQAPDANSCQDFPSNGGAAFFGTQLWVWNPNSGMPGSSLSETPNFMLAQYPYAGSGWMYDSMGNTITSCWGSGFQIYQGCWSNNCNNPGFGFLLTD
jgi:hypothetical protein